MVASETAQDAPPRPSRLRFRWREFRAIGVRASGHQLWGRTFGFAPVPSFAVFTAAGPGPVALEIGGPTDLFGPRRPFPAYERLAPIDLVDYADATMWGGSVRAGAPPAGGARFRNVYRAEANDLGALPSASYDVLLACHVLEHLANPLGALAEWRRVLRPGGLLVLVVPEGRRTFDHRRPPTGVDHLIADRDRRVPESDRTHLAEILALHDFGRDPGSVSPAEFRHRAGENARWRSLHHHVFVESNLRATLEAAGLSVLAAEEFLPYHLIAVARSPASVQGPA